MKVYVIKQPRQLQCTEHHFSIYTENYITPTLYKDCIVQCMEKNPNKRCHLHNVNETIHTTDCIHTAQRQCTNEQNIPFILHIGDGTQKKTSPSVHHIHMSTIVQ